MLYTYRVATQNDLEYLWDKNISENENKKQWKSWKKQFIDDNQNGRALTSMKAGLQFYNVGEQSKWNKR